MRAILVFDQQNDLIYTKYNKKFESHIRKSAQNQGLILSNEENEEIGPNVIIQLFSPIVTSQRIMICQFGNSYTSVQCGDGIKMVFDEYMGFLFMHIGVGDINTLKRTLGICVTIVKHLCGPDVTLLKRMPVLAALTSRALACWRRLVRRDQAALVEAVEPLLVNSALAAAAATATQRAAESAPGASHALLLVDNKLLSLHSSRGAQDLAAADIVFLALLCDAQRDANTDTSAEDDSSDDEELDEADQPEEVASWTEPSSLSLDLGGRPHTAHLCPLQDTATLVLLNEVAPAGLYTALCDALQALNSLQSINVEKDTEGLKTGFAQLDAALKQSLDGLKKVGGGRQAAADTHRKALKARWEGVRPALVDLQRSGELSSAVRCEAGAAGLASALRQAATLFLPGHAPNPASVKATLAARDAARQHLQHCAAFLKVKAMRNFTLGSRASLTINRYLEEFPGLVHFVYVDRTRHRVTAPGLDFSSEETVALTRRRVWNAVALSRQHAAAGRTSVVWKDSTFHYAYFLWFEDASGSPLKPKVSPTTAVQKSLPLPGIMCGDFYQALTRACFPRSSPTAGPRCLELLCVHLGLATGSCVLEHSRRLAATVWEVAGVPHSPADLL